MAFATHIQQVLAFLKAGHPLQPQAGITPPTLQGPTSAPVIPGAKPTVATSAIPTPKGGM